MKKSFLIICILLFLIFFFFLGYFVGLPEKPTLPRLFPESKPFTLTVSRINPQIQKRKTIPPSGGTVSIVDEKGTKISLVVPSGAVEKETEVTLTSLPSIPIDAYNENKEAPGVLIEPLNIKFAVPALLVFDFTPADDPAADLPAGGSPSGSDIPFGQSRNVNEGELTPEEISRRTNVSAPPIGQTTGTFVHTNSSGDQPGDRVTLSPSSSGQSGGEYSTQVSGGGSYNYQDSVSAKDARDHIKNVLNDPNATPEQILEAASLAQAWGFEDLDGKAKEKLKEKIDDVADKIKESCTSSGMPVSKQTLLRWQTLSQALGFEDQAKQFEERQKDCRHSYRFTFTTNGDGVNGVYVTYYFKGSVCGFMDDPWKGQYSGEITGTSTGYFKSPMLHFSLLPNQPTPVSFTIVEGEICGGGYCASMVHPNVISLTLRWDGAQTVWMLDGFVNNPSANLEISNDCPAP